MIDSRALELGFDLAADFESPERFVVSVMKGMRFHIDVEQRFPNGKSDFEHHEIAEELLWHVMPSGIASKD